MVKIEMSSSEPGKVKVSGTSIDINQIISTVRKVVENAKSPSIAGQDVMISLDGFNFSVGKANRNYKVRVSLDFGVKPKDKKEKV